MAEAHRDIGWPQRAQGLTRHSSKRQPWLTASPVLNADVLEGHPHLTEVQGLDHGLLGGKAGRQALCAAGRCGQGVGHFVVGEELAQVALAKVAPCGVNLMDAHRVQAKARPCPMAEGSRQLGGCGQAQRRHRQFRSDKAIGHFRRRPHVRFMSVRRKAACSKPGKVPGLPVQCHEFAEPTLHKVRQGTKRSRCLLVVQPMRPCASHPRS